MENYCSRYIEKPSVGLRRQQLLSRAKMLSVMQCVRALLSPLCELEKEEEKEDGEKKEAVTKQQSVGASRHNDERFLDGAAER